MAVINTSYNRHYSSIYRGVVESNEDPLKLGRCKVRVPSVHGQLTYPIDVLPWARPIAPSPVNDHRGSVNIPEVGDIVWVFFEGAVKDFPVYFGGTYSTSDISPEVFRVDFYIDEGTKFSYDRDKKEYDLQVGGTSIKLSEESIDIGGNVNLEGNLNVSGTLTVDNLIIKGHCNKEGHE